MISCLYSLIYTFPLAMVLTGIFEYFSGSTFDYLRKTVAVFVFAMALSLLKPLDRKRKIVISVLLIILLVTAGTVIVYIYPDIYELITGIYLFIPISFICVFICMIINYLSHYFTFIKYAQAALVLLLCIFCVILRIASEKADVVFAFMFIMTVLGEFVQNRRTVKEKPDTEKHMVSIFPFIFLASMILFAVPVKDEAYDWRFFIDAYNNVCDKIREFRIKISQNVFNKGLDDYLCVYTGFDDEALILPDASGRNKVQVMTYLPYYDYRESVYLSSGEFDIFDGHSWRSESHPSGNEKLIDAAQTVVASVASEQDPEMIYRMLRARITYQDICTATLFAPSKTTCVTDDGTPIDVILENGSYAFAGTEGYGTEYVIEYADINRDGEIISCASDSAEVPAGDV